MSPIRIAIPLLALILAGCGGRSGHPASRPAALADRLPAAVQAAIVRDYPGAVIRGVEKETYPDGTVHWEVELTTKDGRKRELEYDGQGKVLPEH